MSEDRPDSARWTVPGSERGAAPGARAVGALDLDERVEVTVVLRRRAELAASEGGHLTPEELGARFGADPADVALVERVLGEYGLQVVERDAASRRIRVAGTLRQLSSAFGTTLQRVESVHPATGQPVTHRHRTGPLSVPAALGDVVVAVLGLDDRPQARAYARVAAAEAVSTSYTPLELGTIYDFPAGADGSGQVLAVIELGGGFDQADLEAYFAELGVHVPAVSAVGVDGAANQPGQDPTGADGEVLLDIEVAGALAPGATMLVYFAPNTDAGFVDAVSQAAHADPTPTAMSISWGQSEDSWTAQARNALDAALADAAALGVTVTAAAGDSGSADAPDGGTPHVDFPAASPHVLACGGTSLHADASGAVTSETVWNDGSSGGATGGGVSDHFPLPKWQAHAGVPVVQGRPPGRGVPDVAGDADPRTGYRVRVDGQPQVIGGTSAVAPLWAALVCRLAQWAGGRLGLLQPLLYATAKPGVVPTGFRDVVVGSNGSYDAAAGWDPCTGLGSPDGQALTGVVKRVG